MGSSGQGRPVSKPGGLVVLDAYSAFMRREIDSLIAVIEQHYVELQGDSRFAEIVRVYASSAEPEKEQSPWLGRLWDAIEKVNRDMSGRRLRRLSTDEPGLDIEGEYREPEGDTDRIKVVDFQGG